MTITRPKAIHAWLALPFAAIAFVACGGGVSNDSTGTGGTAGASGSGGAAGVAGAAGGTGGQAGADAGGGCNFEVTKLPYLVAFDRGPDAGECPDHASYDGEAVVQSAGSSKVTLSFGQDCIFTIDNTVPEGMTNDHEPAPLPTVSVGAALWLSWCFGYGQPYSGESHRSFSLRASKHGAFLLANHDASDKPPAASLEGATALGLHLALGSQTQCTESVGQYGCYVDVSQLWYAIEMTGDAAVSVPSRASRSVSIDGQSYLFTNLGAYTYTGTPNPQCADGPSLSGYTGWMLWQKP